MDDVLSSLLIFFLILLGFALSFDATEYDSLHVLWRVLDFHLKMLVLILKASNLLKLIVKQQLKSFYLIFVFRLKVLKSLRLLLVYLQFLVKTSKLICQCCDFCFFVLDLSRDVHEIFLKNLIFFVEMKFPEVELIKCCFFVLEIYLLVFQFFLGFLLYSVAVCLEFLDLVLRSDVFEHFSLHFYLEFFDDSF